MTSTSSAFSSSDTAVLEREVDNKDAVDVSIQQIWKESHKKVCAGWIRQNGYKRICLQFPDFYLRHSTTVGNSLKITLKPDVKIFILADTSYGSCCVDEVAAAHVNSDCIIHFGTACRSKVSRLPVLFMYPEFELNMEHLIESLKSIEDQVEGKELCVYLDIGYHHIVERNAEEELEMQNLKTMIQQALPCKSTHIEIYPLPEDTKSEHEPSADSICLYIGDDTSRFYNLSLTTKFQQRFFYEARKRILHTKSPTTHEFMRRRFYYIEKCKDAQTLGLLVATLSADGYLDIVAHIQEMAKSRGIKTQIISVGRINEAKLANFLEIDCFVLIGCPFNNVYNNKDFYKPIVSVFEAEMALNPAWEMVYPERYETDFKQLLPEGRSFHEFNPEDISEKADVSLVSGRTRTLCLQNGGDEVVGDSALSAQSQELTGPGRMEVMTTNSGLTFEDRTWTGLDPALGQHEPAEVQQGLSGIPTKYTHDKE